MQLESIIGLEIHVQLSTASKMFCACDNRSELLPPNTAVCPICLGHPGTLPSPNEMAVRSAIKLGLALGCTIAPRLKFDRKHYFYPDLPKGYQISQYDEPICSNGSFTFGDVTIGIERAHLEEDAAKSFHDASGETLIDFNRGGSPLVETVTRPDFRSPLQARQFLQEIRLLVRCLAISDGDMEKGHVRCDANISLRPVGDTQLYAKTEIKNINSMRAVERALEYEIHRQTSLWKNGEAPSVSSTRGWNDVEMKTVAQRTKEAAHDYRYFPEPDIPPFLTGKMIESVRSEMPELPAARRARFENEYGFSSADARQLIEQSELADFAEHVVSEFYAWVEARAGDVDADLLKPRVAKLVSGWILSKYLGALGELGRLFTPDTVTPENFAEFLALIYESRLNTTSAQRVLKQMIETGADPEHILESEQLGGADSANVSDLIDEVIRSNPKQVEQFKAGKEAVLQFLVGQVMKLSRGTTDPVTTADVLREKLR